MQVIVHTGAHCTDDDRLLKCLLRNKQSFSRRGIAVPGPGKYRELLGHSFRAMADTAPAADARDVLLDAFLDDETAHRIVLSDTFFFGSKRAAVIDGQFYPAAPRRIAHLLQLFPGDRLEIFMALRNPASFLPAILGPVTRPELTEVLGGLDPRQLRWSDCLGRIRAAAPDIPLTIWCNEDTPLIWAPIIREMAGLAPNEKIVGGFDLLATIMTAEGMQAFRAHLHKHPRLPEPEKRDVMIEFLEKYAIAERLEEELDLPGWTDELVEELTEIYDRDVQRIQDMPGIRMLVP